MKIVIIGGVAGGASAAARARRLDETAEIVVLERGEHPSFANCGLPYYVGGKIESRQKLLVAPVKMLRERHRLDVRTRSEVTQIDREKHIVHVRNLDSNESYLESYDKLVIATGAASFRPAIPGIESSRVMELRDLADADRMHAVVTSTAKRAVIVGGGFIGIEVAENLVSRGIHVTLVELGDQILTPWDREMIGSIDAHMRAQGVDIRLNDSVERFEETQGGLRMLLKSGETMEADFAVVSIGVRPESKLAVDSGIECAPRGGVVTNEHMQTSDPDIYAVGDVSQVQCFVSKTPIQIPLAGPANRQGRIAADHIFGRESSYRGTQGTAIVGVFGMTAAMTGLSEKVLQRSSIAYEKVYIHPSDHAGYYPGAQPLTLKLLFDPKSGVVLGAQCVGTSGVDKRIDVIAMAIQAGMTVFDLEEVELCYAPQYGHAKDPVNMAGFVASGVVRGDQPLVHANALAGDNGAFLLDVRSESEFAAGHIPGATNIPLESLRERKSELPQGQKINAYCKVGQRGYVATRILMQHRFDVANVSGGYTSWGHHQH
ncbi:FAD-dependent oxidoreductase [Rubripirellula amarantea]|uniref:Coenzyme A disulfide reductase n=1 Tax=Rubripirellula amarantea TaxID=2527999 RepID=A0A5C5WEE2_9BACT|nr:FAD-dependent oxidoreductase [Rubripirellula amarantea]MDA8743474.1 FAD-dependent oxidoreductase [Rubripirellula amarantea]TWT48102.1 Coenzyme A disulfide reductase [Rubripirellula amarantea]